MAKSRVDKALKIDMPFEDALRRILKAKPVHKSKAQKKADAILANVPIESPRLRLAIQQTRKAKKR